MQELLAPLAFRIYTSVFQDVKSQEVLTSKWSLEIKLHENDLSVPPPSECDTWNGPDICFVRMYYAQAMAHNTIHKPTTHDGGGRPLPWYGMSS